MVEASLGSSATSARSICSSSRNSSSESGTATSRQRSLWSQSRQHIKAAVPDPENFTLRDRAVT